MGSSNVFADKWWALSFVIGLVAAIVWVVVYLRVYFRLTRDKTLAGWIPKVTTICLAATTLVVLFGVSMCSPWPPEYVGEYEALMRVWAGDREILGVQTNTSDKWGSHTNRLLCFDLGTGEGLGRVRLPHQRSSERGVRILGARGSAAYFASPDGYLVVDLARASVVSRESDRDGDLGAYENQHFDDERWGASVLLQSGETAFISMGARPAGEAALDVIGPKDAHGSTWSSYHSKGEAMAGLQRATPVRGTGGCDFASGTDTVTLYLHRSTAFGSGRYLVSAVTTAGVRKWSLDLSDRYDDDLRYEVLLAEQAGDALRLLIGADKTIYWVLLDPDSGRVKKERVLY